MNTYGAYSTRFASTSSAAGQVPVQDILKAAGWALEQTFARFYNKPIVDPDAFQNAVLSTTYDLNNSK
uniref:Uncharacterized protein n=1 Tax=Strigamia maritima TaxID=126957 RepID=T1IQY3_STRMM